jgi:cell wall-associated NlpC family hydrolase
MLKRRITVVVLVGIVLALALGNPRAEAATPAYLAQRGVRPGPAAMTSGIAVSTLQIDLSHAVVKTLSGRRYLALPLENESGWVLSKLGPPGGNGNGVSKPAIGAADEEEPRQQGAPDAIEPENEESSKETEQSVIPELDPKHAAEYQPEYAPIALISADDVNIREKPDLRAKVLDTLPRRTKVYLISVSGPWYYVSVPYNNLKGFVFGSFIYQLKEVVVTAHDVNLRVEPSVDSEIVVVLGKDERFVMLGETKGFYRVISPTKGFEGWVAKGYSELAEPKLPTYKVVGASVNFRHTPNVDAEIIDQLDTGTKVEALGRDEKWSLVDHEGQRGWVYSEYLVSAEKFGTAAGRDIGRRLAARGLDLRGVRYRWGGSSPSGFDCSGFVYFLLREQFGLKNLPRRASEQYYQMGTPVDKEDLEVGDLIFFTTYKAGPSHVGVYISDGNFVHASSAGGKVRVNSLSEGYYKRRLVGARRITGKDLEKYGGK